MTLAPLLARIAVSLSLFMATPPAQAEGTAAPEIAPQTACGERGTVVARLAERYGESLKSLGLQQNNVVLEIYASDSTGTWSILVSHADGTACLVASGQMWEQEVAPLGAPGDDA
ncbi:hypothetical protein [Rhodobacteraceae bacterium DSL-40]|uniref:hypothetical protein n=1 Tax=Amaricoccus sp. B4 TaxID=3368557 RepID=UPI000DAD99E6